MAETFSYDNTPQTEVLTEEEQDSLQVGEQLEAEHEGLLAGKYKNAEDLEAAYLSLQKKLGQEETEEETIIVNRVVNRQTRKNAGENQANRARARPLLRITKIVNIKYVSKRSKAHARRT